MKKTLLITTLLALVACSSSDLVDKNANKDVQVVQQVVEPVATVCDDRLCFIQKHNQIPASECNYFFSRVQFKENIINVINKPSTSRPYYQFAKDNIGKKRINDGITFYKQNQSVIEKIEAQYGVPGEVLTAILGIETHYGRNTGSFRVADSLDTLAFAYPKRAEFFQNELAEFMLMSKELGSDPMSFSGSYAGAMGMPQFMPSSYRKWAKDGDGDGFADIWTNRADALASVANYLVEHGWKRNGKISIRLNEPQSAILDGISAEKTALTRTVADFRNMGINIPQDIANDEPAILYRLEIAPDQFAYYLGLNNFYTVWQYNNSRLYVHSVSKIAAGIRSGK